MKRLYRLLVLAIACAFPLAACSPPSGGSSAGSRSSSGQSGGSSAAQNTGGGTYRKIAPEEAKKMIDAGGATVVDVRTPEEYAEGHIPGAVLVPNESIGKELPGPLPDQNAVLLVYCRSGVRSKQAAEKLARLGYTQIFDFGGILEWPYETEGGAVR